MMIAKFLFFIINLSAVIFLINQQGLTLESMKKFILCLFVYAITCLLNKRKTRRNKNEFIESSK